MSTDTPIPDHKGVVLARASLVSSAILAGEAIASIPALDPQHEARKMSVHRLLTAAAVTGALVSMAGGLPARAAFGPLSRGSSGTSMRRDGETEDGSPILVDSYGKRYVKTRKGTRRLK